ncbi:uncharacterized protein DUF4440 [Algoriphagus boseongensis]|uniref:Uncharacterized protein DUF4440 n=1 Tax=Algoriphagus boseongensis TaxID=1442587 RepID=A0A4R6T9L6_9BACT|nr:nuclear transport factor 2 family protein [Algoriphagus boseongensis]TDQ19461.1 uncharacterized protein DUF4440 [Algoriphagus boseongensis]
MISESELIELSRQKFKIWENSDLENLEKIFDNEGLLICSEGKPETKAELTRLISKRTKEIKELILKKTFARVYGNTGVVHGEGQITLSIEGIQQSSGVNFLDVWIEREEGWKLVSSHLHTPDIH